MKLTVRDGAGTREIACGIAEEMVMQGHSFYPGIVVGEDSFVAECAGYAINEGGVLFDKWDSDDEVGVPAMAFAVTEATRDELATLRRLDALPIKGARIKTEDGYLFIVDECGKITDGDMTFASLAEMGVDFRLTASID